MAQSELSLRIRVMRGPDTVVGPGRADLLGHIAAAGSIAAAGRQMNMSYKRAWALVEALNNAFATPLVESAKGGAGGGGAKLTATGHAVLAAYRALEAGAAQANPHALDMLTNALAVPPGGKTR